jgi:hypothetical protein
MITGRSRRHSALPFGQFGYLSVHIAVVSEFLKLLGLGNSDKVCLQLSSIEISSKLYASFI